MWCNHGHGTYIAEEYFKMQWSSKGILVVLQITIEFAHWTPDGMAEYAKEAHGKGIKVIKASAGGASPLPSEGTSNEWNNNV